MKKFILIFISVMLTAATFAQNVPQTVNFSATVRDGDNNLLKNADLTVRIAINQNDSVIYWEEHEATTNVNGFVSFLLNVDKWSSSEDCSFEKIQWQDGTYKMDVQYKPTSGGDYVELGSYELTSGFYAFVSNYAFTVYTAQNLEGFAIDVEGARDGDVLVYNSDTEKWEASDILSLLQANAGMTTYTITFYANGGTGIIRPQTMVADSAQAITANTFTRTGYEFTGWNTAANGEGDSYTDGESINISTNMTLYAQWEVPTTGTLNEHEWVDLGLPSGLRWATCNVGAASPEDYGDYFAWGEIEPKETYDLSTYRYCNGSSSKLTKYCNNSNYGITDALTTLEAGDDAATVNWGSGWRMPTKEDFDELQSNCTVTWTTQNGVDGRLFTGPNGNSIFLPAAGHLSGSSTYIYNVGNRGDYWSSSLDTGVPNRAWVLGFGSTSCGWGCYSRETGLSVRPVCVSQN